MFRVPAAPAPDPAALANAADALAAAERPVVIADFATRPPYGWDHVIAIAETLGAPVWDCNSRLNFPSDHLLNLSMAPKECYDGADVVLALDIADFEGPTHVRDIATRTVVNVVPETATWIDIGFTDVEVSKWSMDYGRTFHAHHRMTADPVIGTTQLVALLQERIGRNADLAGKIAARGAEIGKRHQRLRADWRKEAEKHWNKVPMTVPRLALEVWRAIKDEDWVLSAGTLHGWARKLWNFDRPYRHAGRELGTGTQIGISLGVALAYKGSGRLVRRRLDVRRRRVVDGGEIPDPAADRHVQQPRLLQRLEPSDRHRAPAAPIRTAPISAWICLDRRPTSPASPARWGGGPKVRSRTPTICNRRFSGRWRRSRRASRRWSTR